MTTIINNENTKRRIDNLGRISLPKSMRDRLDINANDELEFFMIEDNGKQYIACAKSSIDKKDSRKKIAADVLKELGYDVPEELL